MDIDNTKNIFFLREKNEKQNGFDSYSKSVKDILTHYALKYEELAENMKSSPQYTSERWKTICTTFDSESHEIEELFLPPFEMYITAFLLAFHMKYKKSVRFFQKCQDLLPNTLYGQINVIFIDLQIAQLFERMGEYKQALSVLMKTRATIRHDNELFNHVHNFYASCCVSIGLICFRYMGNPQIATSCFLTSTLIRSNYKSSYAPTVYKHYLSQAYRYVGMMPCLPPEKAYIFMKVSYSLRSELSQTFLDDVTKEEMFHLETDFIIFLIRNRYKNSLINLHAKALLHLIATLSPSLRKYLFHHIENIAHTLYRYYSFFHLENKAELWLHMANLYTDTSFNSSFNSSYEHSITHR